MTFQQQEFISAQVWVCDACGAQDHKSCGCNATAHMEALLEKRAQDRARQRRHREKTNENNDPVTRDTVIDFPRKFQPEPEASAQVRKAQFAGSEGKRTNTDTWFREQFIQNCRHAIEVANNWAGPVDAELKSLISRVTAAWSRLRKDYAAREESPLEITNSLIELWERARKADRVQFAELYQAELVKLIGDVRARKYTAAISKLPRDKP